MGPRRARRAIAPRTAGTAQQRRCGRDGEGEGVRPIDSAGEAVIGESGAEAAVTGRSPSSLFSRTILIRAAAGAAARGTIVLAQRFAQSEKLRRRKLGGTGAGATAIARWTVGARLATFIQIHIPHPPSPGRSFAMANLIKIGHFFLNLDRVEAVEDLFATSKEDKVVVRFGAGEGHAQVFTGKEADDLRTWLNSKATNLHDATDLDTAG
jgi:hypothetical protein